MTDATLKVSRPLSCGISIPSFPGTADEIEKADKQIKQSANVEAVAKAAPVSED